MKNIFRLLLVGKSIINQCPIPDPNGSLMLINYGTVVLTEIKLYIITFLKHSRILLDVEDITNYLT